MACPTVALQDPNAGLDAGIALFRWTHFLAGVLWIGHLYFFNFVNAQFQAKIDAPTKQKVNPELLPRALFWFRWGAAITWITGFVLLFALYYHGPNLIDRAMLSPDLEAKLIKANGNPVPQAWLPGFLSLIVGFLIYDPLFKALKTGTQQALGAVVWGAILIGIGCVFERYFHFSGRAILVHVGAILGTVMAANVWMRIWPAQRRILTAVKAGQAADAQDVARAGARSRQNTYMSVPLLLLMVSWHHPVLYGGNPIAWQFAVAIVFALAFFTAWLLYRRAAKVPGF
jgi:uncharacterized membrane protein